MNVWVILVVGIRQFLTLSGALNSPVSILHEIFNLFDFLIIKHDQYSLTFKLIFPLTRLSTIIEDWPYY